MINEKRKQPLQSALDPKSVPNADLSQLDVVPPSLFELVQSQSATTLVTPSSVLQKAIAHQPPTPKAYINVVQYRDFNEVAYNALAQARRDFHVSVLEAESRYKKPDVMHKWCHYQFEGPACSHDMVRCMKALQPYLQVL